MNNPPPLGWGPGGWGYGPGDHGPVKTEDQRRLDDLANDVDVMRTKLEELSTLMYTLNDKMEILWSAPGMPGFHDAKTAWTLDSKQE